MKLAVHPAVRLRCLYCHDSVGRSHLRCECGAVYHTDCLSHELHGMCATLGCGPSHRQRRPGYVGCCQRNLPREIHYECEGCGVVRHRRCLLRSLTCCPGATWIQVPPAPRIPTAPGERSRRFMAVFLAASGAALLIGLLVELSQMVWR